MNDYMIIRFLTLVLLSLLNASLDKGIDFWDYDFNRKNLLNSVKNPGENYMYFNK